MEINSWDSDDEVFMGNITERERNCQTFNSSRRRTTVYFPGVSRPGSQVSFHQEHTDDGTLIFSFENMDVSGKEQDSVERSICSGSESKGMKKKSGGRSKKQHRCKETQHHALLYEGSDVDSGLGSVNSSDGSSETFVNSPSLRCESDVENKLDLARKLSSDDKMIRSGHSSLYQSPPLSLKRHSVNHLPFEVAAIKRTYNGKTTLSTRSRVVQLPAATLNSEVQPELLDLPSGSEVPENLSMYQYSGSGYMSPATSTDRKGMKRKIAQRSPSFELKTDFESNAERMSGANRTEKENRSPIMLCESDGGLGHSFDMFHLSRKLQKVDIYWEKLLEAEELSEAQIDWKLSACRDTQATHKAQSASQHVDSDEGHPSVKRIDVDVSLTTVIPSSQLTEMDAGHMIVKESNYPEITPGEKYQNKIDETSKTKPSTAGEGMQMDLTLVDSPVQFSSPSPSGASNLDTAHSLVPASGTVSKLKPLRTSTQSLMQPLTEGQRLGSKYGNLMRKKPMTWKTRNKENVERNPLSAVQNTLRSYQQLEDDSRETMTRINTLINAETKHTQMDPNSSPALLTHFPPPKRASRVSWSEILAEEAVSTQSRTQPTLPPGRSILQQRADNQEFPFSRDPPSPIILTRRRLARLP